MLLEIFFLHCLLTFCFRHFQVLNIKYLEDKFYKSKGAVTNKLMERRREDVRDQMMELSAR